MSSEPPGASPSPSAPPARAAGGIDSEVATLVFAAVFLYYGFWFGLVGTSDSELYNGSVAAFVWMARVVGVGMLLELGVRRFGPALVADRLDLLIGVIAAGGCLIIGGIWVAYADYSGILLLAFGVYNATIVRGTWERVRAGRGG